ncbi:NitT/TauT family transport system ATP-binding protein [Methylopila capsulata]|uniref:NitT/TauT family transport system ATP-binding protein n=1 Tax=Methylopila capsulata TaxID=61654 RepID=A0A9W6IS80_9HYPH|nr:ABC transporter ATP-binding protein [Methylopila capsulata]MBM7851307.1 NitT/TauT family transport system ATP-binding protein [Methylopila capsulata]GLK54365.1 nitrate/sulfonate/bicarbonate ABC transporter ATP-binding protein [Methylopila capsulata]
MTHSLPPTPFVALERVSKTFASTNVAPRARGTHAVGREIAALDGFDLTVGDGEVVALLGPSGCGKSTALRMIAGLTAPTSGAVVWRDPAAAADIGMVLQDPTLAPWSTVADNVRLPLRLKGISRTASAPRVAEALARVGLADRAGAYPGELSGGMRMRVSIARALVARPRLLLLDEPFGALDEITRFKLNDELLALKREHGWTVVFVTHSVFESVYLADRIVVMTPRPGRAADEITVTADEPRSSGFRMSPAYAALCRGVSQALGAATDAG